MAQRRQVLDTGYLPGILTGVAGGLQRKREQQEKLQQLFAAALASKQAEAAYPNAEEQAKQQILMRADEAGKVPQPMGGYNQGERQAGISGQVEEAAGHRALPWLQQITGSNRYGGSLSPVIFDPNTGKYTDTEGRPVTSVDRGAPVRNKPLSADLRRTNARETALGTAEGTPMTPEQQKMEFGFTDMVVAIDNAIGMMEPEGEFQTTLLNTGVPFRPGAAKLEFELTRAADNLLRLKSGAAINEQEYQRLRSLLPQGRDAINELVNNPGLAHYKLTQYRAAVQEVMGNRKNKLGTPLNASRNAPTSSETSRMSQMSDEELQALANQ